MDKVIIKLFREITGRDYNHSEQTDHIFIQKIIYLLGRLGVNVGDYTFSWDNYGPYSLQLSQEVVLELESDNDSEHVEYSDFANTQINSVKKILTKKPSDEVEDWQWLEIICSLLYIKRNVAVANNKSAILKDLTDKKAHFSDISVNQAAYKIMDKIDRLGCYNV